MACSGICSAAKKIKNISHVIFDMDGVLLDTEITYRKSIATIAQRFGKSYTPTIQGKVVGTVANETARIAVTEMQLPMTSENFLKEFQNIAYNIFKKNFIPLMPGAEKIVRHLHANKIPIAVATSSSNASFEIKTRHHKEFFSLFNHIVCGGSDPEVKAGKPSPDVFLVCASRFPDKPISDKCLVLEDAPNGVEAAKNAGMNVVMIPDENVPQELRSKADIVVGSLEDVPLDLFGLPTL